MDRTEFSSPVQIPGTTWSSISAGIQHSLATKTDNTLWSWGNGGNGRLGQNTTTNRLITSTNTRNHMEFYKW
jgi:alpha-tubulin suppressor-like RCC1 family protein